ncbi:MULTISPECIES: CHAT domain-containing protein [unclassified Tolypothrix]|uniref:CHAT domain-containing protein n=1 Tax=unclassified Tolypothrix TaxID=2649714 RepID=UPI0005EAA34F|nr:MULTISPECIES: CHAT domain-containing protein [unclassified Tolypothrix]BAY92338.1 TPR repeat protein [Microchaete diplosiphon NIES-3275]EKE98419.1 tetratricopeptide repeat protein [Tolypothrix sp. PCC 7601]MBE9085776.1 CHAT domain-containing protein [Tolypothrix sp. LEGE 11397]UYD26307.1 CHAT domain-containing protein [Tolypothrix sp. PCC 7712]UYD31456.1 CHAT domain-containing protein [Tolypothrix sp. PCC 7601]
MKHKFLNKKISLPNFGLSSKRKIKIYGLFGLSIILTLLLVTKDISVVANQPNLPNSQSITQQLDNNLDLLQQGKNYYQKGQYTEAAKIWEQALKSYQDKKDSVSQVQVLNYLALAYQDLGKIPQAQTTITESLNLLKTWKTSDNQSNLLLAQALNTQGTIELLQGQTETAIDTWKQATTIYERAGDNTGKLISQINQAQGLQNLGQYRRAKTLLEELIAALQSQPDSLLKAQSLRSLGVALQTIGDLKQSKTALEKSLAISQKLNSPKDVSAVVFSLGNIAQDLAEYDVAIGNYQEVVNLSPEIQEKLSAQLNQLSVLVKLQRWEAVEALIPAIENNLAQLAASRPAIYARINFAETLMTIEEQIESGKASLTSNNPKIAELLVTAIQQSREIKDSRSEAYALQELGKLYQDNDQLAEAKKLTQKAQNIAQEMNAADLLALTATQSGAIAKAQGDIDSAIAAYETAFNNIQSLRGDLVAISTDVQFDFKESIEPIYREYVGLLLERGDNQKNLKQARQVIEALQIAELDNYFRDACVDNYPVNIDKIDVQAAVIYPIILSDRLEVILSIPKQPLHHYTTKLSKKQVENTLRHLYSYMSRGYIREESFRLSQRLYTWLIAPAEERLNSNNVKTLVFVLDGLLRNLPMSALHDGDRYLIEKYNVALSPGLQLFPQGLQRKKLDILAAGLTEARQGFSSLPAVTGEIKGVTKEFPAKTLLNQEFTRDKFKKELDSQSFPIVHLATHGQFSSNPQETFLLTWSDRISILDFDRLFQKRRLGILEPVELLVMSACQTATGDNRATLGLAGLALRSGAKSTIASLWSVNDDSTANLMKEFYQQLNNPQLSKAEALRQAQIKIMANPLYQHPYFWASFVLVGNWL